MTGDGRIYHPQEDPFRADLDEPPPLFPAELVADSGNIHHGVLNAEDNRKLGRAFSPGTAYEEDRYIRLHPHGIRIDTRSLESATTLDANDDSYAYEPGREGLRRVVEGPFREMSEAWEAEMRVRGAFWGP